MRIKPLSSAVANQIAAGEVIENPASVVKELLENALDAKANVISIDIGFGGLNQIKISDNGIGILADDLPLAIAPHATSKLTRLSDLSTLTSMGFRGEALASIASISHLTLSSKPSTQEHAMMLQTHESGVQLSTCARNQGTTVDVRDLFYNAPVRRRFLRSERSEYLAIEHVVKRFALSAPHISLALKHNGKPTLELPAAHCEQTQRLRIQKILGKAFIDAACFLDVENGGMRITGWVSSENYQRSQNDKQWFYLNQRMVRDKLILHAFKQAYDNRLHPGRHPSCLIYLTMPTIEVDVNVHPTKHEVRFQQPRLIHDFIGKSVSEALAFSTTPDDVPLDEESNVDWVDVSTQKTNLNEAPSFTDSGFQRTHLTPNYPKTPTRAQSEIEAAPMIIGEPRPQSSYVQNRPIQWTILNAQFGLIIWKSIPYLFDIIQGQKEQALTQIHQQTKPLGSRPLLVPVRVDAPDTTLQTQFDILKQFGIQLEINNAQILVRTIPIVMPQLDVKLLLQRLTISPWDEASLPQILASCQMSDSQLLSADEKDQLGDYIRQQLEQNKPVDHWCISLNRERCAELIHG